MADFAELLDQLTARFETAGIESARADAELLVAEALEVNRGEVQAKAISGESPTAQQAELILEWAARREAREPLQHLTGRAYFRNLTLKVGKGVFVPRPETELVAGLGVDALRASGQPQPIAVDLGTGSGAIALSMATEVPNSKVFAVELSPDAIFWTAQNFADLAPTAELRQGDLADAFPELNGTVSVVISNPPYIPVDMVPIYPEVVLHDPELALYGGNDGLDLVRAASKTALRLLHPGGFFAVEHADIQSDAVVQLLLADGWRQVTAHKDFNFRDRAVSAIR
ncbi:MAG: peptide chain release factor N(5)-glutamine methyltransferase [Micrococcales bacterium]